MIDEKLFGRYEASLLACTDLTKLEVEALLKGLDGLTPQQKAARLLRDYPGIVQKYGLVASELARQWYQQARDQHFEDDEDSVEYEANAAQPIQRDWTEEDVQKASAKGLGNLTGIAVRRVMQRADQTMAQNVRSDPAHPCWAIVPSYGACGFCVMVGSNGFYMKREPVNVKRHDHCRCTVVADWDTANPQLKGYDPGALYDAYHEAEESTRAYAEYAWSKMGPEERKRYEKKGYSAFDRFKTQLVSKEIKRRDPTWVQTGKPIPANYSEKARSTYGTFRDASLPDSKKYALSNITGNDPERKDLFIHDVLSRKGFFVLAHETKTNGGYTNIDSDTNGHRFEFKSPEAGPNPNSKDELKFVQRNVHQAKKQFDDEGLGESDRRVVMSNYYTKFPEEREMEIFKRFCDELVGQRFAEGMFVTRDGRVLRAK